MIRNDISQLRNSSLFLFTDEEMNPRQDANRDEVLRVFTPLANNLVAKILEAGNCSMQRDMQSPVAKIHFAQAICMD